MKRIYLLIAFSCMLLACSNYKAPEAIQQIQYARTHTGYANEAAMQYALDHQITPDSAVVILNNAKK